MARNRASAKAAGSRFERSTADYLSDQLDDDRIDRRVKYGANDRGDISGVRMWGLPVTIECKDHARLALAEWVDQAEIERGNDDGLAGVVIHKRKGTAHPGEQYVTMTVDDLVALIRGHR